MASSYRRPVVNYYEILEVSANASLKEINSAYKRLALKHHPDKRGGDDAAIEFQKINIAVETLRDSTARASHDKQLAQRHKPLSEEEVLFSRPDYTGWKPDGMYRSSFNRRDRYKFSFGESVHMSPNSPESREELARCEKAREEDKQMRENLCRASETPVEDEASPAGRQQNWRFVFNPEADPFREPEHHQRNFGGTYSASSPEWWAGAEPQDDKHGVYATDTSDDSGFAGESEDGHEVEAEAEAGHGPNSDVEAKANASSASSADADPTESRLEADALQEDEPDLIDLDFDNVTDGIKQLKTDTQPHTEALHIREGSQADCVHGPDAGGDVDTAADGHASTYTVLHVRLPSESSPVTPDSFLTRKMSGAWPPTPSEARTKAYADSTAGGDQESAESIYYDFSDTAPSQASYEGADDPEGESHESTSNVPSSVNSSIPIWYDPAGSGEATVHSHLAPFIPYFTTKLEDKRSQYTKDDCYGEMKGMVMETYCGWLENLRVEVPGAPESANSPDQLECRHLGYWNKEIGQGKCEACDLWRPIFTLVCPGCGIKRCVRCKFGESR